MQHLALSAEVQESGLQAEEGLLPHGAPEVAKQQRVCQHRVCMLRVACLHQVLQPPHHQLLVLLADEAVVEHAQKLVAPQAQQLARRCEHLWR